MSRRVIILIAIVIFVSLLLLYLHPQNSKLVKKPNVSIIPSSQPKQLSLEDIFSILRESSPTASTMQTVNQTIAQSGKQGDSITFKGCEPDPQILKAKSDQVSFINSGAQEIQINGIPTLKNSIKPGQSISVKIVPALYPYTCQIVTSSELTQIKGILYRETIVVGRK